MQHPSNHPPAGQSLHLCFMARYSRYQRTYRMHRSKRYKGSLIEFDVFWAGHSCGKCLLLILILSALKTKPLWRSWNFMFLFMNFTFFFISFTCFSRIRARTGIRAPNKRKHWKFSTRAHLRKMYTNTTAQTGQKRSIQIHCREDVHQYCKSKRLRNGSPPTPPPRDINGKTPST